LKWTFYLGHSKYFVWWWWWWNNTTVSLSSNIQLWCSVFNQYTSYFPN